MRVLVIGAGPSGLAMVRQLRKVPGASVTCMDRFDTIGGVWHPGAENRQFQGYAMYKGLTTNVPQIIFEYPDFPHNTPNLPDFLNARQMFAYFKRYTDHHQLWPHFKFNSIVSTVQPADPATPATSGFIVNEKDHFDVVVNANGNFWKPKPRPVEISGFTGPIMHSFDFARAENFTGQRVLVIGTCFSGDDLNFLLNQTAKRLYFVYRRPDLIFHYNMPKTELHMGIKKAEGNTIFFSDGQIADVDSVILAHGYDREKFPYLLPDLQPKLVDQFFPLYKHLVHPKYNMLAFSGLHTLLILPQMHSQACFMREYLTNDKLKPKSEAAARKDIKRLHERFLGLPEREILFELMIQFEFDLYQELMADAKEEPLPQLVYDYFFYFLTMFEANRRQLRHLRYFDRGDGQLNAIPGQDFDFAHWKSVAIDKAKNPSLSFCSSIHAKVATAFETRKTVSV